MLVAAIAMTCTGLGFLQPYANAFILILLGVSPLPHLTLI